MLKFIIIREIWENHTQLGLKIKYYVILTDSDLPYFYVLKL